MILVSVFAAITIIIGSPICFADQVQVNIIYQYPCFCPLMITSAFHLRNIVTPRATTAPLTCTIKIDMDCHGILDPDLPGLSRTQAVLRPSSPSNVIDWYAHPTPSFERNFCSNFTCCGQSLADLHELVDHFEEAHVVVIGPDGNHVHPSPRMGSNPDSPSAGDPSVMPFTNAVFADRWAGIESEIPGGAQSRCASAAHTFVGEFDAPPVDHMADQLGLPPASFTAEMECTEFEDSHAHQSRWPASSSCMITPGMRKKRPRGDGVSRRRDKAHKCPRPRCTKSYLNANGLKYHLEKGRCSFEPTLCLVETLPIGPLVAC
ncbi:hypothetical protein OG21DRAFT_1601835 [Imleria badia]|nr:hypothetical protein OG21DRAFT_1601835 [Imleria badia]